ncbi:DMT family transporter [Anoxybacillus ayderensis]|nr:DMT family transporter [Anoxybacillus ayderensis]
MLTKNLKTYILLFLTATIWGGAFVAGKVATTTLHPVSVAFFRFFGASLILFPLLYWKEPNRPTPTRKDWIVLALLGLVASKIL